MPVMISCLHCGRGIEVLDEVGIYRCSCGESSIQRLIRRQGLQDVIAEGIRVYMELKAPPPPPPSLRDRFWRFVADVTARMALGSSLCASGCSLIASASGGLAHHRFDLVRDGVIALDMGVVVFGLWLLMIRLGKRYVERHLPRARIVR
jgi:hypothetical protein